MDCIYSIAMKIIPPFEKGEPGGISDGQPANNPPRSPFFKGGSDRFHIRNRINRCFKTVLFALIV